MKSFIKYAAVLALALGASPAFAQYVDGSEDNTNEGTTVTNEATVTYEVNGVVQEAESDDVDFVVDRAILVTVASLGDENVSPDADDQALAFTVTNDSNDTLDFVLSATNAGGDDFNADSVVLYVEDGTTAGFQIAEDTLLAGNRLTNVPEEDGTLAGVRTVYVVGDIPGSSTVDDGDTADLVLMATAYEVAGDGGGIVTETNTGVDDDPTFVDTVFGDAAGTFDDGLGDTDDAEDGRHSDTGTFTVASATIAVTKSSTVISDPFNGVGDGLTIFPKAIPGAVIEYCILITNSGGTDADNVTVSDPVPANTTYVAESIVVADDCDGTNPSAEDDDTTDEATDETDGISGDFDSGAGANGTVNTEVSTLADGDPTPTSTATIFRVTVD